jgi:hypothetical protein
MLSRPRPGSGETEVPPEALVEPISGHTVVRGGGNIIVGVALCGIRGEWLLGGWPNPSSGETEFSPRLRATSVEAEFPLEGETMLCRTHITSGVV